MLITAMITRHHKSYLKTLFAFLIFSFSLFILLWTKTGNSNNINGTIACFFVELILMILSVLGGNVALLLFPSGHVYGL